MRVRTTLRWFGAGVLTVAMGVPATASAATLAVDDDLLDCPSAGFTSVQEAVTAASPGDVVAICPGVYEEGPATVPAGGANAVSIAKMLTIRGAGASKVTIRPKPALTSLLGTTTTYRNTTGAVIGVYRSGVRTLVDISGVTVEGGTTTVGSGVKFYNAEGSLTGSVVRNVAPLTGPQGYGVVVASNLNGDRLPVRVAGVQISGYAKAGVLLDSTQTAPALGILAATITGNTITGSGIQVAATQQGVLATGLVSGSITNNVITANAGSPDAGSAGVRLVDLDLTPTTPGGTTTKLTATANSIFGNGYGMRNETGAGADQTTPFTATGNWWGHASGPSLGLPRTTGDPVNGAAVNVSGFRTTPIAVPTVPSAVADAAPAGELDPPAPGLVVRPATAYRLRAIASDDLGVKSVAFKAGNLDLGADADAPYAAPTTWTPGAALEGQSVTLTATITDSAGQATVKTLAVTVKSPDPELTPEPTPTATPTPTPTPTPAVVAAPAPIPPPAAPAAPVVKPKPPTAVSLSARAAKGRKLTLSGALTLPAGTSCPAGGTVRVSIQVRGTVKRVTAKLGAGCAYRVTLTLPRSAAGRKVTVKARFLTTGALLARSAPQRKLTVKR